MNSLFNVLNQPTGRVVDLIRQYKQFQTMFKGDAKAQVQRMLSTGQISQEQYNQAVQMAQQVQSLLR